MSATVETMVQMPAPVVREKRARDVSGLPVFFAGLAVYAVGVWLLVDGVIGTAADGGDPSAAIIVIMVLLFLAGSLIWKGLFTVAPGEVRVLQFLGRYVGTVR